MTPPSSTVKVELLERTDAYAVVAFRRLMLLVWRGQANAAGIDRSRALFQPWSERQPGGAAFLIVIPGQRTRPPDEETREAMQRTASAPAGPFRGMATLVEAEGFIAATVRAIMLRLHARSAEGATPNLFGTPAEAAAWAAAVLDDPALTAEGLAEAIATARAC